MFTLKASIGLCGSRNQESQRKVRIENSKISETFVSRLIFIE